MSHQPTLKFPPLPLSPQKFRGLPERHHVGRYLRELPPGEGANHAFEPSVAACTECHAAAEDFDINASRTEVEAKLEELKTALGAKGMWDAEEDKNVVGLYPEAEAAALWNYIYLLKEDKSMGVHNSCYTNALLDASLKALQ